MPKKVPKSVICKIERMNRLMQKIVDLNIEVEQWIESNGISDGGFDFTFGYRDDRGYAITDVTGFVDCINEVIEKR